MKYTVPKNPELPVVRQDSEAPRVPEIPVMPDENEQPRVPEVPVEPKALLPVSFGQTSPALTTG
jgi:hypothetical protein